MSGLFKTTKPFGEDVLFRSSTTGEHDLDVYLEAAERGGKTLGELIQQAFDSSGNPLFASGNVQAAADAALASAQQAASEADSAADSAAAAQISANAAAASAVAASNAVTGLVSKSGDTMTGALIQPLDSKTRQEITTSGSVNAAAGIKYVIAANNVTLVAPVAPAAGSYHGVVICDGVTGFVWNFGSTKIRGATPGTIEWDLPPRQVDFHYHNATRGYV